MPRSLPEWVGKTDDTPAPPRVKLRVLLRYGRRCDLSGGGCGRVIGPTDAWTCDHIIALVNGGQNRESNLHPLCGYCNPLKTANDQREKSRAYHKARRHAGIKERLIGRRLPNRTDPFKIKISRKVVDRATGEPWRGR